MVEKVEIIHREPYGPERFEHASRTRGKTSFVSRKMGGMVEMRTSCARSLAPLLEMDPSVVSYEACPTCFVYEAGGRRRDLIPDLRVGDDPNGPFLHVVDERFVDGATLRSVTGALADQGVDVVCIPSLNPGHVRLVAANEFSRAARCAVDARTTALIREGIVGSGATTLGDLVGRLIASGHDRLKGVEGGMPEIRMRLAVMHQAIHGELSVGTPRKPGAVPRGFVSHLGPDATNGALLHGFRAIDAAPVGRAGTHDAEWDVVAFARTFDLVPGTPACFAPPGP